MLEAISRECFALPPPGFRPAYDVWAAHPAHIDPHRTRSVDPPSDAQLAGIRYEERVKTRLLAPLPGLSCSPWWEFYCVGDPSGRSRRYCQPDAIQEAPDLLTIFEIKLRWCALAWWQLERLYAPVARALFPGRPLALVCITRSYDPGVPVPEHPRLLDQLPSAPAPGVGVFLWK